MKSEQVAQAEDNETGCKQRKMLHVMGRDIELKQKTDVNNSKHSWFDLLYFQFNNITFTVAPSDFILA